MAGVAREIALEALLDRQGYVTGRLDRLIQQRRPAPADAGLATELALGVVRHQRTLDAVLRRFAAQPKKALPPALQQILRLGAYQILFLDRVPDFAAVSEAVDAAQARHPRRAGFVNGVLRNVGRSAGEVQAGKPPLDRRTVALSLDAWRGLDRDVFFDPAREPVGYLGEAVSLPDDLARRWLERSGDLQAAFELGMQVNVRPPIVARVDLGRTSVQAVIEALAGQGVQAVAHANGRSVVFRGHVHLTGLEAFNTGLITPQDATATAAGQAVQAEPGMRVLDFCAAPGTKTTQIGEQMLRQGTLVAADVSEERLELIRASAARTGLENVQTLLAERVAGLEPGSFDRVLVDVPCSNTGVLARRVEARWRFRSDRLGRIADDQRQLLMLASVFLRPGGRLIYSTCSIEPEENEQVVQTFLRRSGSFRRLEQHTTTPLGQAGPDRYHDGGYWAALSR